MTTATRQTLRLRQVKADRDRLKRLVEQLMRNLDEAERAIPRWIPAAEALPDCYVPVLIAYRGPDAPPAADLEVCTAFITEVATWFTTNPDQPSPPAAAVVAWQPIPKPPTGA